MKTATKITILRNMQDATIKDFRKTEIRTRKIKLAKEIIAREKTIVKLINELEVWD